MTQIGNVLSLFDGISCGQLALQRANIQHTGYYASEIEPYAMAVSKHRWPGMTHLGDVRHVNASRVPKIDMLIAGSPCQGFSLAGKRLNFDDPRSSLFFEVVRLIAELKPRYFMLENVRMEKWCEDTISEYLGVKPIAINSNLVSAQNRYRLYWTNIPGIRQPEDLGLTISDIVQEDLPSYEYEGLWLPDHHIFNRKHKDTFMQYQRIPSASRVHDTLFTSRTGQALRAYYLHSKVGTLTTKASDMKLLLNDGRARSLTRNECERLQTVPDNYTCSIPLNKAKAALGNGWTVDVIAHIFDNIQPLTCLNSSPVPPVAAAALAPTRPIRRMLRPALRRS